MKIKFFFECCFTYLKNTFYDPTLFYLQFCVKFFPKILRIKRIFYKLSVYLLVVFLVTILLIFIMSLDNFIQLSDNLVEFEASLSDKQFPLDSVHSINIHKDELKYTWEKLKSSYYKCLSDIQEDGEEESTEERDGKRDDETASLLETVKEKYKKAYLTYCRCFTRLEKIADEMAPRQDSPITTPTTHSGFKLPPCEIPMFHGDYASWPTFRDMFTAVCIKNSRLSAVERLFHLNQSTKGEAHDIVKKVPLTNENFKIAWTNLCSRYENKRVLVNIQLKVLFNLPVISTESGESLKKLQRDINSCISLLRLYDIDVDSWGPIFIHVCSNRLPDSTLTLWEQTLSDKTAIPKWSELDSFLTSRYRTLESVKEIRKPVVSSPSFSGSSKSPGNRLTIKSRQCNVNTFQATVSLPQCHLCPKENHIIRKCPRFLKMNPNQRWTEIRRNNLCLNCFSKVHTVKNCTSKFSCYECNKKHNTLLHRNPDSSQKGHPNSSNLSSPSQTPLPETCNPSISQSTDLSGNGVVQSCFSSNNSGVLLGTALVQLCHNGFTYRVRALVDSGSEGTLISDKLFNSLKLPFKRKNVKISGLNNTISATVQKECSITLRSNTDHSLEVSTSALVVPHLSGNLPSCTVNLHSISGLPDIPLADPKFFESSKVDILLGGDILPSIMLSGIQRHVCGSLIAQETIFGWILTGPLSNKFTPSPLTPSHSTIVSYFCEISIDKEISRFWEVEDIPRKVIRSHPDQFCEDLFTRTTKRNPEGRYIVSLPIKEDYPEKIRLGHSRNIALAQFVRNENRLLRSPTFKQAYDNVLKEYITLGHMTKVNPPVCSESPSQYYLPHHSVIKPDSTTTKVRVVFNASAPTSNGLSLNDILHTGPILQNDLTALILKWRLFRYVFNGDITKMYRQILVDPKQTQYQRILFRQCPSGPIEDYELKTVTFGVNCAPYLAIRTILQLAEEVRSIYPLASDILKHSMYVDDALVGAHSIEVAIESRDQLIAALNSAGFEMRKWTSNSKFIISDLPPSQLLHEEFLELDDRSTAKTLGIRWNAVTDSFYFSSIQFPEVCKYTKREVLSHISKLFDPAGWLAPCIVIAKIIMQRIWVERTPWDEVIDPESLSAWKNFQACCSSIESIQVPRWLNYTLDSTIQFHGFCDASEKAYAAALFVRIETPNSVFTHLVTSKTRVAPIKTISIPKLELCGAVLLSEIVDNIIPQLNIDKFSLFCWTDSTIVLSWLARPPCYWTTFVANRVSKIIQVVDPTKWYHVSSEDNPADLASRGVYPQDLMKTDLWWNGPYWLIKPISLWPKYENVNVEHAETEKRHVKVHFSYFDNYVDILDRFSSFPTAIRVIAYVYRFYHNTHPKFRFTFRTNTIQVTTLEVQMVQNRLILIAQKSSFPDEYMALLMKKPIAASSSILCLNPFLDSDGIIRSSGRLVSSPALSYDERHPVILPYNCQFSRLYVRFIHLISLHGGNQLVLRLIRAKFWIPRIKNLIKCSINNCKPCILYKRRCHTQLMSALPPERSEISRPFVHTGLDFAGPFDIKSYAGRACRITKGYVCVFVCFSTKAIHLEATSDLSTSAFLAAFSRFVSRRGCPLHLHSDNGTTFVGASKVLAKEFIQNSHWAVTSNYAHQNLTWHFIPPGAPHMGGLWEAGVKSFKSHFKKVAGNFKYTFEEFQTLLYKIEACLNSRPISPTSQDPSDLSALTPGHFLIGSPILVPIDPYLKDAPISISNRWQRLKVINQNLCMRWKEEYLKELHKRYKWQKPSANLEENMMVVIRDENLPPNSWRLGRISKVYPGPDARVRVADIRTERGTITRPITKLVVLPSETTL